MSYWIQGCSYDGAQWERRDDECYATPLEALERRDALSFETRRNAPAALTRYRVVTDDGRIIDYRQESIPAEWIG